MATAEKYVNNSTAKKCKYYTIPNSLHFVMCCRRVADTSFSVLEYDFFFVNVVFPFRSVQRF